MRPLLLAALAAVAGCNGPSFDPASFVDKLRLLGVEAMPPELAPGEQTTLTAVWANPGGATPTITWDACLLPPPPGSGHPLNEDCIGLDGGAALVPFGTGETVTATMPAVTPEMLGLPDASNGFYVRVRLRLEADGRAQLGFFGLRLYLGPLAPNPPNQNPALTGVFHVPSADAGADAETALDDAVPLEVHAHDEVALRALVTPESQESYLVYDGDPRTTPPRTATETVRISWFATAGEFSNDVTGVAKPDTTLKLEKHLPPSGTPIDLWVVARDERGGADALHRTLVFR